MALSIGGSKLIFHVCLIVLSTTVVYLNFELFRQWNMEQSNLFIAIPSSPENFKQRQSLRETWLQLVPDTFNYKFLVGKNMCDIHRDYRKSDYSCKSLNISLQKDVGENTVLHINSLKTEGKRTIIGQGFIFMTNHPIIIHSLGVRRSALTPGNEVIAKVALYYTPQLKFSSNLTDPPTKLFSVTFHSDFTHDDDNGKGYIYKKLTNPVHCPKGFEGLVIVENVFGPNQEEQCEESTHWNHANPLTILNIVTNNSVEVSVENYCVSSSFGFSIKDFAKLEEILNKTDERRADWNKYIQKVHTQLEVEADQYNDILFLDMIDTYRNLPKKMILFFKWLFDNFNVNYLLKTDDDVFVNILKVQQELEKPVEWDWWSCFRIGWPVKRSGKWRETYNYKEEIYPPFPTGSGYVLSKQALDWLKERLDTLSTEFQGEDVAMGVWLQGLDPRRHAGDSCCWACVDICHPHCCNTMELTVTEVYKVWHNYEECGVMCGCKEKTLGDTLETVAAGPV